MILLLFAIAIVVLLVAVSILLSKRGRGFEGFFKMFVTGLDSGFSLPQIFFLARIGRAAGLEDSSALFWSSAALDKCTAELVRRAKVAGPEKSKRIEKTLSALYDYRRKMDLEQAQKKRGIASSRDIEAGQHLSIVFPGAGVFSSKVMANSSTCLTVDFPKSDSVMATDLDWNGRNLKVFFWRVDDAGYVFSTRVIPSESDDDRAVLMLEHSDNVIRNQMRKNRRVKCSLPAQLYIMEHASSPSGIESVPGMKCILKDLSESGAKILIGGQAVPGMKIKIQFMLQYTMIVMAGTAKGATYSASKNRSIINFECIEMNPKMKNEVLAFVYNALPETKAALGEGSVPETDSALPQDGDELPDFAVARNL